MQYTEKKICLKINEPVFEVFMHKPFLKFQANACCNFQVMAHRTQIW